jgi:hypothetical protein
MKTETRFEKFATKEELEAAYVTYRVQGDLDRVVAAILVEGMAVYVPHLYRGGWVIRGFGYSTERIGQYVPADRAGRPETV